MIESITQENSELVLRIPMRERSTYTYGEGEYEVDSLCGLAWGDEYSIASLNYLDYKDDFQVGMPIIMLEDKEEWEAVCKKFNLMVFEYRKCAKCKEVLSGCFTIDDDGNDVCIEHEKET
jgi:hypothetical protein